MKIVKLRYGKMIMLKIRNKGYERKGEDDEHILMRINFYRR